MTKTSIIGTIVALVTIVGTVMGLSTQFVSQNEFTVFQDGTIKGMDARLDRIEGKLDRILERQK